jgi:cardiolipin synthase (CMP-forming)
MWAAHLLTVSRIPLALAFWAVATRPTWGVLVLATAALTDVFDGAVARRAVRRGATGRWTRIGGWLDPVCDKVLAVSVLGAIAVQLDVPLYYLALIGARELVLVPVAIAYRLSALRSRVRYEFRAARIGKLATAAQFVAVIAIVVDHPWYPALAGIAGVIGVAAASHYLGHGVRLAQRRLAATA